MAVMEISVAEEIVARYFGEEVSCLRMGGLWYVARLDLAGPRAHGRTLAGAIREYARALAEEA